jgi:hypothetical protein
MNIKALRVDVRDNKIFDFLLRFGVNESRHLVGLASGPRYQAHQETAEQIISRHNTD